MVMHGLQRERRNKPIIFCQLTAFIGRRVMYLIIWCRRLSTRVIALSFRVSCSHQLPAAYVRASFVQQLLFVTDSEIDLHRYITLAAVAAAAAV